MITYKIAAIVGSLRKNSFNRQAAENFIRLAPNNIDMQIVEIGDLEFYNEDLETDNPPRSWTRFRETMKGFDGVFFFTPEYNRSLPAVIKNAIDVGSRPYGQSIWDGMPAGVASATIGSQGAYIANHNLRQSFVFLNMPAMQQPEIYLSNCGEMFDEDGKVVEGSEDFFRSAIQSYAAWIEQCLSQVR